MQSHAMSCSKWKVVHLEKLSQIEVVEAMEIQVEAPG